MKTGIWRSFTTSQVASAIATSLDYATAIFLYDVASFFPQVATAIGALIGACVHFSLGRHWCFMASQESWKTQALRYGVVATFSMGLNVILVGLLFDSFQNTSFVTLRIVAGLIVGFGFNFPLHQWFVFRKKS